MNSSQEQLAALLLRWEESWEQGQDLTAEHLCADCPDLVSQLQERIDALKKMAWMNTDIAEDIDSDEGNSTDDPLVGKTLAKRYRIDQLIGEGGFGRVYRAFDAKLQRKVAIKVTHFQTGSHNKELIREARRIAQLRHPGIVAVHDIDRDGDTVFIVSDLIAGMNLAQRIQSRPLTPQEAVGLVAYIADALHSAHQQGFIHRDIKPANILIDKNGRPLITDFGIATTAQELGDGGSVTSGTLPYMSPEQLAGEVHLIDARTDVYALGVVLYELLTGKLPFRGRTPAALREQILFQTPEPVRAINEEVPQYLESICHSCLGKHPSHRPKNASVLAASLRTCLHKQQPQQTSKIPRRLIALPVLLITIGLAFLLVRNSLFNTGAVGKSADTRSVSSVPRSPQSGEQHKQIGPGKTTSGKRRTTPASGPEPPRIVSMEPPNGATDNSTPERVSINFITYPLDASILVDGSQLTDRSGKPLMTPCTADNLPGGLHHVVFRHADYEDLDYGEVNFSTTLQLVGKWPKKTGLPAPDQKSPMTADQPQPPHIISMNPPNGATDVDPNLQEIRVTFDQSMAPGCSWINPYRRFPDIPEGKRPLWVDGGRTCILLVRLKPDSEYRLGLNDPQHRNFKSSTGVPLEPVVYTFRTRGTATPAGESSNLPGGAVMALSFEPDHQQIGKGRNISFHSAVVGEGLDLQNQAYIEISHGLPTGSSPRSLSVWLKSERGPVRHNVHVLTYGANGENKPFGIMQAGGKWRFYDNSGGLDTRQTIDQRWHHHCITYDGRSLHYYLDNYLVATASKRLNTAQGPLVLGATTERNNCFSGMIDELALFDRALSAEEVKMLWKMGIEGRSVDRLERQ